MLKEDVFKKSLQEKALHLGFVDIGVIELPTMRDEISYLKEMIRHHYHGTMSYLERNHSIREEPRKILDGAKRAIVTLTPYRGALKELKESGSTTPLSRSKIASFALGEDYHTTIKDRLHTLASSIEQISDKMSYRVFTDSAPIFEKSLAERAGLGFIGKSGMLISPKHGIFTLIGIIITTAQLPIVVNSNSTPLCGSCRRCIDACPTAALIAPYRMDATKCISYKTIEDKELYKYRKGDIGFQNMIFGCDICIEACPWSRVGSHKPSTPFLPHQMADGRTVDSLEWSDWLEMENSLFNNEFKKSALLRAGLEKIKNSIEYEMANKG